MLSHVTWEKEFITKTYILNKKSVPILKLNSGPLKFVVRMPEPSKIWEKHVEV